ncbi:phasin family protein [Novosphingobium sp. NDB2Meth1]|uniref:phasin family protein n=1 Tax=Novosphingobium sp. NDB2Meth1 TaxID=1892847 RepID=UPI000931BACB|nr:phasin family protein [Novosphingobium sp. NDB2Meth1]
MEDEVKDIADAAIAALAVEAEIAPAELPAQSEELAAEAAPVPAATQAPKLKGKPGRPRKVAAPALEATADAPVAPAAKPARKAPAKLTVTTVKSAPKPAAKTSTPKTTKNEAASMKSTVAKQKDFTMNAATTEMTETIQTAMKEAAEKAKAALEKSQAALGDMGAFTKGNVEAVVESTKILATGIQEMTKSYAAETKTVVETMQAEIKELAAVKSPAEFFEKQNALLRKQFDAAVAATSKNSEAMLKLASEAFQPISNRVSLAVEKMKQAA